MELNSLVISSILLPITYYLLPITYHLKHCSLVTKLLFTVHWLLNYCSLVTKLLATKLPLCSIIFFINVGFLRRVFKKRSRLFQASD